VNDPLDALRLGLGLLAWAIALQCLEDWRLARSVLACRVATWQVLGSDLEIRSARWYALLKAIYAPERARVWTGLRLGCALALLGQAAWEPIRLADCKVLLALWFLQLLTQVRWRGALNGGSDLMTLSMLNSLLFGLCLGQVSAFAPGDNPVMPGIVFAPETPSASWTYLPERAALWLICIHLLTSYFVAGAVKMLQPEWRSGQALIHFLDASVHGSLSAGSWLRIPRLAALIAWSFMVWEVLMPLSLLHPRLALMGCVLAAAFHLLIFVYLGLNRFLWIWLAGFPAVVFAAAELAALGAMQG
jgi:hypothetical protein